MFTRTLDLHELARFRHHDVHIDLRARVLLIRQIQAHMPVDKTDGHCSNRRKQGILRHQALRFQVCQRIGESNICAGNRGSTRTTIRLKDIAIQRNGVLPQRFQIDCSSKRTPHQTGNLMRPPLDLSPH